MSIRLWNGLSKILLSSSNWERRDTYQWMPKKSAKSTKNKFFRAPRRPLITKEEIRLNYCQKVKKTNQLNVKKWKSNKNSAGSSDQEGRELCQLLPKSDNYSCKKCFCLREPFFWGRIFLILRRNFPIMEEDFPNIEEKFS